MLSDILSGFCPVDRIVFETGDYLLARVVIEDRQFFAEVTPGESGTGFKWPGVQGVLLPVNQRGLSDGNILLLFPDSGEEFLWERLRFEALSLEDALPVCRATADILRGLHSQGKYLGYIGPECLMVSRAGRPQLLGGRRGIPDVPYSAPEAIGRQASDPRSDVFALGSLLFRLIAGSSRDRDQQIRVWNEMPDSLRQLIHRMVCEDPVDRFPSITALKAALQDYHSEPPPRPGESPREEQAVSFQAGRKPWQRRGRPYIYLGIAAIAAAIAVLILFKPFGTGNRDRPVPVPVPAPPDTVAAGWVEEPADTVASEDPGAVTGPDMDSAVVWISNCTGVPGVARNFRGGPAAGFSYVYTTTGTSQRSTSVMLCRRLDPRSPLELQPSWPLAGMLVGEDTTITVLPSDLSILLGTDLYYDGVNREYLLEPVAPAGTLYVDVANNGIQYTLGGMGAATWVSSVLNGRCVMLDGEEWLLSVVDTRDGDQLSEELGIPELLDATLFLFSDGSALCPVAEEQIRLALQALPAEPSTPPGGLPVPDFWILLGTPSGH